MCFICSNIQAYIETLGIFNSTKGYICNYNCIVYRTALHRAYGCWQMNDSNSPSANAKRSIKSTGMVHALCPVATVWRSVQFTNNHCVLKHPQARMGQTVRSAPDAFNPF